MNMLLDKMIDEVLLRNDAGGRTVFESQFRRGGRSSSSLQSLSFTAFFGVLVNNGVNA